MSPSYDDNDPQDIVPLERFAPLHLIVDTPKGRGVFASRNIPAGTIIDVCAALVLDPSEATAHIAHTALNNYTYNWPYRSPEEIKTTAPNSAKTTTTQAVVFGLGSLFNHSTQHQNIGWTRDLARQLVTYRALRDIHEGEELCISYGDHLTFEDADAEAIRAEAEAEAAQGGEEAVLARIEL